MRRYQLSDVGPMKLNCVLTVDEDKTACYGLEEWLSQHLGMRVIVYHAESGFEARGSRLMYIRTKWQPQSRRVSGEVRILNEQDADVVDITSFKDFVRKLSRSA